MIKIPIEPPVKGVNRTFARNRQPELTCWDALNVMPFDRTGRIRMGQRSGISKLWANALDTGPIMLLLQTTRIVRPNLLNESFTYADGALESVSGGLWQVRDSGADLGGSVVTDVPIVSNQVVKTSASLNRSIRYTPTLVLGTEYRLSVRIKVSNFTENRSYRLYTRVDPNNLGTTGIAGSIQYKESGTRSLIIEDGNGNVLASLALPANTLSANVFFTLELQVNGDDFAVRVIGNTIHTLNVTSSLFSSFTGVGLAFVHSTVSGATTTIDDFLAELDEQKPIHRATDIVAVSGGGVYQGDIDTQATLATGGTDQLDATVRPQATYSAGQVYFVDGTVIRQLDLETATMVTYAATAGTAPARCTLACMYRDRLVLAAPESDSQNFFMSRVGTHTDWNYAATDPAAAFAGNASEAGRIGEPIVALIPSGDDVLLIGGDHNLWAVRGDPAAGGAIDLVSDSIGLLGPNAWCKSPDGVIYFVGTGGLFRMTPGAESPDMISVDKYNQFFKEIDRGVHYVLMAWDRDNHGCYIFVSPVNSETATHLWYDARTEALLPIQFPNALGPLSALVYDGDGPDDRMLLIGGRDGFVYKLDEDSLSDDGTAISSRVVLGPYHPSEGDSVLTGLRLNFGELDEDDQDTPETFKAVVTVKAGKTPYDVTEGTPLRSYAVTFNRDGRTKTITRRLCGEWFTVTIANSTLSKYWSMESGEMEFEEAGPNIRQR